VTQHEAQGCYTFSIWDGAACLATFRLRDIDAPRLQALLQQQPAAETRRLRLGVWRPVKGWLYQTSHREEPAP
jgi:hypothetical protein